MEYIKDRFVNEENRDYNLFCEFARHYPDMFDTYVATEYGCPFDLLCRTVTGGTYCIELKYRNTKYDTCFIEWDKYTTLKKLWNYKKWLPVYICFFENEIYMWILSEVSKADIHLNIEITAPTGEKYLGDRIALYYDEAYRFVPEGKKLKVTKPKTKKNNILPAYIDDIKNLTVTKKNYWNI